MIKNKIKVSTALIFVFFLFTACALVTYHTPVIEGPKRIAEKNYEINQQQTVYAGDKMMEARDYWATFNTQRKMMALNDFTIEGPYVKHSGSKGDMYNLILTSDVNKQLTFFIEIPGVFHRYGIGPDGKWLNAHFFEGQTMKAKTPIKPEDTTFEHVEVAKLIKVDASKPFTYFEIIFTGIMQDAINLLYREYTPDNLEQPAFQESLAYTSDVNLIRYNEITIQIHDVTRESISYTVLDDGMPDTPGVTPGVKP
jgi:hypothetical protein